MSEPHQDFLTASTSSSLSHKTCPKKRLKYYPVVYSSTESEGEEINEDYREIMKPKINDYIIVKVYGKKSVQKFIANVTDVVSKNNYKVRFMIRCPETKNKFVFSNEDEAIVLNTDIIKILHQPSLNSRLQYYFSDVPNILLF